MKQKMIATRAMRYGTRALVAGDEFTASRRNARLLTAIGRAEEWKPDPLDPLRAEAEKAGVDVDRRWGEARLRKEIEAAKEAKKAKAAEKPKPAKKAEAD